jgi:acyl carrier protein
MSEATQVDSTTATPPRQLDEKQSVSRFLAVVAEVIGLDEVAPEKHFLDVGGDSLSAAIFIDWIAQEFGVEPELDWFFESASLQELADRWWSRVQEQEPALTG